jgi:hypothetical protein
MTISSTKITRDGSVYEVIETGDHHVERKRDAVLSYVVPVSPVPVGTTVDLHFTLQDFDGEARTEDRDIAIVVDGEQHVFHLQGGVLTLSLELQAVGLFIIDIVPSEVIMTPVRIQVE